MVPALLGALFFSWSLSEYKKLNSQIPFEAIQRQQRAMAAWPSVDGTVLSIEIVADTMELEPRPVSYQATVRYEYDFEGKHYSGSYELPSYSRLAQVQAKLESFRIALPEEKKSESLELIGFDKKFTYSTSQSRKIFVNPSQPENSVLDPHAPAPSRLQYYGDGSLKVLLCCTAAALLFLVSGILLGIFPEPGYHLRQRLPGAIAFGLIGTTLTGAGAFIFWREVWAAEFPDTTVLFLGTVMSASLLLGGIGVMRLALR